MYTKQGAADAAPCLCFLIAAVICVLHLGRGVLRVLALGIATLGAVGTAVVICVIRIVGIVGIVGVHRIICVVRTHCYMTSCNKCLQQ